MTGLDLHHYTELRRTLQLLCQIPKRIGRYPVSSDLIVVARGHESENEGALQLRSYDSPRFAVGYLARARKLLSYTGASVAILYCPAYYGDIECVHSRLTEITNSHLPEGKLRWIVVGKTSFISEYGKEYSLQLLSEEWIATTQDRNLPALEYRSIGCVKDEAENGGDEVELREAAFAGEKTTKRGIEERRKPPSVHRDEVASVESIEKSYNLDETELAKQAEIFLSSLDVQGICLSSDLPFLHAGRQICPQTGRENAIVLGLLKNKFLRDRFLVRALLGPAVAFDISHQDLRLYMHQLCRTRPALSYTYRIIALLESIACNEHIRSQELCASLAYLHWWAGNLARAQMWSEYANAAQKAPRLVVLIHKAVERCHLSPWLILDKSSERMCQNEAKNL